MVSHAANPIAEPIAGSMCRVYFNCRDAENRSHVGWLIIDLERPREILDLSRVPALEPGPPGSFDDSGVSLGCLVRSPGQIRLYYVGWNLGKTTPWRNAIGLATLTTESGTEVLRFQRYAPGPILDRDPQDAYNLSYPWVLRDGGRWRMWYGSNLVPTPADLVDVPHAFKHADSEDGVHWRRDHGRMCLGGALTGDCAFTKPCVLRDSNCYRMWYSHRGEVYQLGYAESADGLSWTRRDDQIGIAPSPDGWDSESLSYPCVFDHDGQRFLLYNGRGYGATGFGLAVLETP
jgi:hypothetical protein